MGLLRNAATFVFGIDVLFLLLLGFSLAFGDPGSGSYVVAQLTLIPVVATLLAAAAIIYTDWTPFE